MSDKGRILVADSTEALLLPITDLLRIEGYECNYVPDTGTVIEILKYVKFDILIAAINMSKSCALEIIHELPVSAKKIPVILVTDVPLFNAQINSLKTSVTVCLNNPIHFEELLKHVKCLINGNAYN
jgi:DNA-binding response OmpR family regulator